MKYTIASITPFDTLYWKDADGRIVDDGYPPRLFTGEEMLEIVNNDPEIIYRLGYHDRGVMISEVDINGKTVKVLQQSDFTTTVNLADIIG
jgi:YD repeat-containing protein